MPAELASLSVSINSTTVKNTDDRLLKLSETAKKLEDSWNSMLAAVNKTGDTFSKIADSAKSIDTVSEATKKLNTATTETRAGNLERYASALQKYANAAKGVPETIAAPPPAARASRGSSSGSGVGGAAAGLMRARIGMMGQMGPLYGGMMTSISGSAATILGPILLAGEAVKALTEKVIELGVASVEMQIKFDKVETTLLASTGSTAAARDAMDYVSQTARNMGLDLLSAAEGYAKMTAAAKGTSVEGEKTRQLFEALSKTSVAMGLSQEQSSSMFKAFTTLLSKGVPAAEQLRRQLSNVLPGAFNMAAEAMGMSVQQMSKAMKAGQVDMSDFVGGMTRVLTERFGGAAFEDALDRTQAQMNRFTTAKESFLKDLSGFGPTGFAQGLWAGMSDELNAAAKSMEDLGNTAEGIAEKGSLDQLAKFDGKELISAFTGGTKAAEGFAEKLLTAEGIADASSEVLTRTGLIFQGFGATVWDAGEMLATVPKDLVDVVLGFKELNTVGDEFVDHLGNVEEAWKQHGNDRDTILALADALRQYAAEGHSALEVAERYKELFRAPTGAPFMKGGAPQIPLGLDNPKEYTAPPDKKAENRYQQVLESSQRMIESLQKEAATWRMSKAELAAYNQELETTQLKRKLTVAQQAQYEKAMAAPTLTDEDRALGRRATGPSRNAQMEAARARIAANTLQEQLDKQTKAQMDEDIRNMDHYQSEAEKLYAKEALDEQDRAKVMEGAVANVKEHGMSMEEALEYLNAVYYNYNAKHDPEVRKMIEAERKVEEGYDRFLQTIEKQTKAPEYAAQQFDYLQRAISEGHLVKGTAAWSDALLRIKKETSTTTAFLMTEFDNMGKSISDTLIDVGLKNSKAWEDMLSNMLKAMAKAVLYEKLFKPAIEGFGGAGWEGLIAKLAGAWGGSSSGGSSGDLPPVPSTIRAGAPSGNAGASFADGAVQVAVHLHADGTTSTQAAASTPEAQALGAKIGQTLVRSAIIDECRQGGIIYRMVRGR